MIRYLSLLALAALLGCVDVTIPGDTGSGGGGGGTGTVGPGTGGTTDETLYGGSDASGPGLVKPDATGAGEAGSEPPPTCASHCDCPLGHDCINAQCHEGAEPVYCCGHPACPSGAECWVGRTPGVCP